MANNPTHSQHWVPEFYLKKFANQVGKLVAFDMRRGVVLKKEYFPSQVCHGDFFYGVNTGESDDISQLYEAMFQERENEFAGFYDQFCEELLTGSYDERRLYEAAQHLGVFLLRTPAMRTSIDRVRSQMMKDIATFAAGDKEHFEESMRKIGREDMSENTREEMRRTIIQQKYGLEENNLGHLQLIAKMEGFGNLLYHKKWRIHYIPAAVDWNFITSDTPVIDVPPIRETPFFYGPSFLQRTHYFPLTPKILIEFINPNNPGKRIRRDQVKTKEEVDALNILRLNWSFGHTYSSDKAHFQFVTEDIEKQKAGFSILRRLLVKSSILGAVFKHNR